MFRALLFCIGRPIFRIRNNFCLETLICWYTGWRSDLLTIGLRIDTRTLTYENSHAYLFPALLDLTLLWPLFYYGIVLCYYYDFTQEEIPLHLYILTLLRCFFTGTSRMFPSALSVCFADSVYTLSFYFFASCASHQDAKLLTSTILISPSVYCRDLYTYLFFLI